MNIISSISQYLVHKPHIAYKPKKIIKRYKVKTILETTKKLDIRA